ncbi:sigma-54-dependent Fis family transcriptional regulator [Anaeromyxobacter sp. Fw109-5]|uniref:sigma-54-dependent Fis family transcriptional regulator n=1 Tax=Anaeromyxobacter sp. (strain Fw109-5) TaxID=404589 RepID=UPI00059E9E48|nr:sigma-54-dependent Fis family transcriptional regulator [Anaeromyxobacter sp. Fw109-5]
MPGREAREVQALHDAARVLWLATDLREALDATLSVLQLELGMENGTLSLFDPVTGEVFIEAAPEMRDRERILGRLRPGEGIVGRIFATGMPMAVPDIGSEPLFLNRTGTWRDLDAEPRAFLGVPVRHGRTTLGVLTVDRRHGAGPISFERDLRFLEILAGMVGARVRLQELENPRRRAVLEEEAGAPEARLPGIVGVGRGMREVLERVERVARSRATVLVRGESGTGKELVARALHEASPRTGRPFVALNCAALPEALLESELFGHEKGAFTGAAAGTKGRFELADGGTLFLDEVGELSLSAQAKLLRAIQERQFERVGGRRAVTVDVRIVAATNRDLDAAVRAGEFRLDLFHRLSVVTVLLPPLRERREDVPALAEHLLRELSEENGREVRLGADALDALLAHDWPGNVRQLRNVLEAAVVSTEASLLRAAHLGLGRAAAQAAAAEPCARDREQSAGGAGAVQPPAEDGVAEAGVGEDGGREEREVRDALARAGYVKAKAARLLGMTVRQLDWRVRKYGIAVERF